MAAGELYTLGHSTRSLPDLTALLAAHGITTLVDVRAAPYSRRHPQFNREPLAAALAAAGVTYRWLGDRLGGLRDEKPGPSAHPALGEPAFRAYATHMGSRAFAAGIEELAKLAADSRIAVMCAEAAPEHCHRRFIADYLTVHGWRVLHVTGPEAPVEHQTHEALRVADGRLYYDRHSQPSLF